MTTLSVRPLLIAYMVFLALVMAFYVFGLVSVPLLPQAWAELGVALGLGVGAGLLLVWLSRLAVRYLRVGEALDREFRQLMAGLTHTQCALLAILSGFTEELLFRGVLQPALGLWIATAIFAILHTGPNRRYFLWPFFSALAGLIFGVLVLVTGNLLASALAHALVNYLNLRHLSRGNDGVGKNASSNDNGPKTVLTPA